MLIEYGSAIGPFNFPMQDDLAKALELELEKNPQIEYFKAFNAGFSHFIEGERADVSVVTDDTMDEQFELMDTKSMDWSSFQKNPLVAFNHNYNIPPLGKSIWQKLFGGAWKAKTIYNSRPSTYPKDKDWFPDSIFHMIKSGFLPGKSVGGVGEKRKPNEEELKKYPTLKSVIYNSKVYEYSVVPRQANNNAIVEAVSKGLIHCPIDIINNDFPEIATILKDLNNKKIILEPIQTEETYRKSLNSQLETAISDLQQKTPELIEGCLSRLLGRV